jgi:AcrR family transcriptional regulator
MPRSYRLGRRAEIKTGTRARIVAAAMAIYRAQGVAAASNLAIARAADVAPATVRNHFPRPDDLSSAVLEAVLAELRPPGPEVLDGVVGTRDRLTRLAWALAEFYERSEPWWQTYAREPALTAAWAEGADWFERHVDRLYRMAIEPLDRDEAAVAVVATIVGPPAYYSLRGQGLSADRAVEIGLELAVPWLEQRAAMHRADER